MTDQSRSRIEQKQNPFAPPDKDRDKHIKYLFDEINEWFFNNDTTNFDPTFFESLEDQWISRGTLSDKQYSALQNIYETWVCH